MKQRRIKKSNRIANNHNLTRLIRYLYDAINEVSNKKCIIDPPMDTETLTVSISDGAHQCYVHDT